MSLLSISGENIEVKFESGFWHVTDNAGDDRPPSVVKLGNRQRLKTAVDGPVNRLVIFAILNGRLLKS